MQANQAESNTRLPRAVVRRSAAIQARIDAKNAALETDPASDDTATPPPAPSADAPNADVTPTPPAVEPPPALADPPQTTDWEQKARSAMGRLTKQAEQHRTEVEGFKAAIAELTEQVNTLQASQPTARLDIQAYFTPDQIEQFGEDQCEASLVAAEKRMRELLQEGLRPIVETHQRQQLDAAEQRAQAFKDRLQALVPDFEEIDNDPDWLDVWLVEVDETTGTSRGEILTSLVQKGDVQRTAKMFQAFKASRARPAPLAPPVVPNGTGSNGGGEPAPRGPALMAPTGAEVREFYKRAALGKVSEQERVAFEARLAARSRR